MARTKRVKRGAVIVVRPLVVNRRHLFKRQQAYVDLEVDYCARRDWEPVTRQAAKRRKSLGRRVTLIQHPERDSDPCERPKARTRHPSAQIPGPIALDHRSPPGCAPTASLQDRRTPTSRISVLPIRLWPSPIAGQDAHPLDLAGLV